VRLAHLVDRTGQVAAKETRALVATVAHGRLHQFESVRRCTGHVGESTRVIDSPCPYDKQVQPAGNRGSLHVQGSPSNHAHASECSQDAVTLPALNARYVPLAARRRAGTSARASRTARDAVASSPRGRTPSMSSDDRA
jgi:hypothetical protein